MTPYEFGDVILVPFPFTDQSQAKKCPAVIISSNPYNQTHPDVIVMALSSNLSALDKVLQGWHEAGLPKATAFKPIIATFETVVVVRKLGKLLPIDEATMRVVLGTMIG